MVGPSPLSRAPGRFLPSALLLILTLLTPACVGDQPPVLSDLNGLEAFKAQVNADAGKPRVVLLLSPT